MKPKVIAVREKEIVEKQPPSVQEYEFIEECFPPVKKSGLLEKIRKFLGLK